MNDLPREAALRCSETRIAAPCDIGAAPECRRQAWPSVRQGRRPLAPDVDRGAQLEVQAAFGGELEVLLALRGHDRAGRAAPHGADRRAFAAARDAADDGPEAGAAADLAAGLLALTLALALVVAAGHRVDEAAEPDGAQLQRDL